MASLNSDSSMTPPSQENQQFWIFEAGFDLDVLPVGLVSNLQVKLPVEGLKELNMVEHIAIEVSSDGLPDFGNRWVFKISDLTSIEQTLPIVPVNSGVHNFRVAFVLNNEQIASLDIEQKVSELTVPN